VPPVTVKTPDGTSRDVTLDADGPGIWRAVIDAPEHGVYRLQSGKLTAIALSGAQNSREMAEVTASSEPLAPVLEGSGGGAFFTASRPGSAPTDVAVPRVSMLSSGRILHGSGWLGLKNRDAHVVKGVALIPLFSGFAALAVLLGLVSLTWWREGR
jgi:hypothetical protein